MRIAIVVLVVFMFPQQAFAQLSNAQTIAGLGGRILGAGKACGVDGNRLARSGEKVLTVSKARANSDRDRSAAVSLFMDAYNAGISEVSAGRTSCSTARSAVADLESKLSGY
jgi:hypothetical protein